MYGARRRVAITGVGCVSAIGSNVSEFRESLLACRDGIAEVDRRGPELLDDSGVPRRQLAAAVRQSPCPSSPPLDDFAEFAVTAAHQAVEDARLPVEQVSWNDACDFCRRLGDKEAKNFNLPTRKYRLPTEAEWEYACRATATARFYTGDGEAALGEAGWYDTNSGNQTHPVGTKAPNRWGLYDMHGNVWQWCSDFYGPYGGDATDPTGPAEGTSRVLRGGSWLNAPQDCRSANRDWHAPDFRVNNIGFRVCLDF